MSRKGFTLVELMVVILIVAILAAVAIPIMRGRIDAAKWSEGRAMMGTIATAIRAYCASCDANIGNLALLNMDTDLGFVPGDLKGTYFVESNFVIASGQYLVQSNTLEFEIKATRPDDINKPDDYTLDETGMWVAGGI
jgi:prepilin-type N-terminal cleavage/methylation domain-containing protein